MNAPIKTALFSSLLFFTLNTEAGDPAPKGTAPAQPPSAPEKSKADLIWSNAVIYEDTTNPVLQKLRVMGRYHTNYAWVEDDEAGTDNDWESRRTRVGFNMDFLKYFELRNEWNMIGLDDENFDPEFSNIDTLFLAWKPSAAFQLTAGKHKAPLTQEFRMSSNEMPVIERTVITQSIMAIERHWGISARGQEGPWQWLAGYYSGSFAGRYNEDFDSSGPAFGLVSLGYDFGGNDQPWEKALVALHYANTSDARIGVAPKFDNIASLNFEGKKGRLGLLADALSGWGEREASGFHLTPTYDITPKLQGMFRYSLGSGDPNTLDLRRRYENLVTRGSGDEYHSVAAGLNWLIYGQKLKLMTSIEYLDMNDDAGNGGAFDGITGIAGLVFWF